MQNKVEYWLNTADDDVIVAKSLLDKKHYLWTSFLCNLVTEKALKAVVASVTEETPPKTHDLHRLVKLGKISGKLSDEQKLFLDDISKYQIEARYPETKERIAKTLNFDICKQFLKDTEEFLCWTKKLLEK